MNPFQTLKNLSKKVALYHGINSLLEWDQETYMPKGAIENRSAQNELIAGRIYKEKTSPAYRKALSTLINIDTGDILISNLSEAEQAAVRQWRRDFLQTIKLPIEFIQEMVSVTSNAVHVWATAKESNSFKDFAPHLEKIVHLCRKKAEFLGYKEHPYDALIDLFEPHMTTNKLTVLFEHLKIPLVNLLKKLETKKDPNQDFLHKNYSKEKQRAFGEKILTDMGLDKRFHRLDESIHPMCTSIYPHDIRITTRISSHHPLINILSCLHEGGHGLYMHNLPKKHFGTPLAEEASLGINESQSRTWETIIGKSSPFWQHYFPLLLKTYPENLTGIHFDDFYRAINTVQPSLIRTDSDEVTYNLHIMLRFEIEKELIEGTLQVKDLPKAWNEKSRKYLGIEPKADSEGCLQDIHWSLGSIGYFPTYALGNLYAAQFFAVFEKDHSNWKKRVATGELTFIANWYKDQIYQYGRQYAPEELCKKVTGAPISEQSFIAYLEKKYLDLYRL